MILIADSGSTKTLWVSRVGGELKEYVTAGLNPRMTSEEAFNEVVGAVRERLEASLVVTLKLSNCPTACGILVP